MNTTATRILALIMALAMLILAACANKSAAVKDNLTVTNDSDREIGVININYEDQGQGAKNADESPMQKGDSYSFNMGNEADCLFQVDVLDLAGNLVTTGEFRKDFTANAKVDLYVRDDANGHAYITDVSADTPEQSLEPLVKALEASIEYDEEQETLRFTIPEGLPSDYAFNILVAGRVSMGDGSMSIHLFEDENSNNSWEAGKTYSHQFESGELLNLSMSYGVQKKWDSEVLYGGDYDIDLTPPEPSANQP